MLRLWEIHPALVAFPIAFLVAAAIIDVLAWSTANPERGRTALLLYRAGLATGVAAAASGLLAWYSLPDHSHAVHELGQWHMWLQLSALALVAWRAFSRATTVLPRALALLGVLALAVGADLGGRLVFRHGAGVDPTLLRGETHQHRH